MMIFGSRTERVFSVACANVVETGSLENIARSAGVLSVSTNACFVLKERRCVYASSIGPSNTKVMIRSTESGHVVRVFIKANARLGSCTLADAPHSTAWKIRMQGVA